MSHLKFIYQEMCWQPLCETVSVARCRAQAVKCSPIYWTWDRLQSYLIVAGQELQILWRWSWWVLGARWETAIVRRASKHFNLHPSDAVSSLKVSNTKPKVTLDGLKAARPMWVALPDTCGSETFAICGSTRPSSGWAGVTAAAQRQAGSDHRTAFITTSITFLWLVLGISSTCDHVMEDEEDLIERATNSAKSRSPSIGESLYASTILSIEVFSLSWSP